MLRVVEAFSGIGSQARALRNIGVNYKILNTIDWDIYAICAYDIIHNGAPKLKPYDKYSKEDILKKICNYTLSVNGKVPTNYASIKTWKTDALKRLLCAIERTKNLCSITDITAEDLPEDIDLMTYSFPCQDLSICGSWHGNMSGIDRNAHNRSGMLWEVERLLKETFALNKALPKFLLMENVSNILSRLHCANFEDWKSTLSKLGYVNQVYTLDASKFGSPQKRVRTYMLSVLCTSENTKQKVLRFFEQHNLEKAEPYTIKPLKDFLRIDYSVQKYKTEADYSNPNNTPSRRKIMEDNTFVYNKDGSFAKTVNTMTTKQDRNPTSGLVYYPDHGEGKMTYRNFTPRECLMLMGFDEDDYEVLEANNFYVHNNKKVFCKEKYEKFAGNSIVICVLEAIFKQVVKIKRMRTL